MRGPEGAFASASSDFCGAPHPPRAHVDKARSNIPANLETDELLDRRELLCTDAVKYTFLVPTVLRIPGFLSGAYQNHCHFQSTEYTIHQREHKLSRIYYAVRLREVLGS
jgi:hypothetical protein